jgi:hypothetical protein
MADLRSWRETSKECPGIDIGRLYTAEEIDAIMTERHRHPPVSLDE